ncbi:MAG: Na-K-Cl cotransporter [Myxococcota bacterium]
MPELLQHLDRELFRLSETPVTPLTLALLGAAFLLAALAGPTLRAALRRWLVPATDPAPSREGGGRFGTFGGVFTPSILTILGVVMYLRVGWVVGNVGLAGALAIVVIAHLITFATGLSISSIATNRTVGVGGAYFIISRSLGASAGAAIGIPLFLGQALSVTFYIVGFTESLSMLFPNVPTTAVSSAVLFVLTAVSLKSADLAIKVQYVVMVAIAASLVSFFGGWLPDVPLADAARQIDWWVTDGEPFARVFAVFFPAVTGIMAGVGMSGDLKDARRSIPRGTLWAIGVGFLVYLAFPAWLALNASASTLATNKLVVFDIARLEALIYVGVWGATLSSAVGSILTAPRTLQALGNDRLAPRMFARGFGPNREPRLGILATYALAQTGILLGDLDVIAPVLTMFFLATYGLINIASGLEKWAASPSYRPDFRVPAPISLAGGIGCIYVMSIINLPAMVAAAVCCGVIYAIAQRKVLNTTYGDARHGIWAALVRSALQRLRKTAFHPLNWRPNLLILGGDYERRPWLLRLGSIIVQDRGLVTFVQMVSGDIEANSKDWRQLRTTLDERLKDQYPNVFGRVDLVHHKYEGAVQIAQAYGIGNLEANTVMLGWPRQEKDRIGYVRMLRELSSLDRSLLIVHYSQLRKLGRARRIDIWWGGLQGNGGLMLLSAYLITAHHEWRQAQVTIRTVVDDESQRARAEQKIRSILASARVEAEPVVVLREGRPIAEIMHEHSAGADLAIAGLRLPPEAGVARFFDRMNEILRDMPTTILVHSARDFEGEPVLFDQASSEAAATDEAAQ